MGKFDGILICTDFDGTFALPGAVVSRENAAAVEYFEQNGGRFTLATGRSPSILSRFEACRVNAPLVAANGTMICYPDTYEIIESFPLSDVIISAMDELAELPIADKMYLCDKDYQGYTWTKGEGRPSDVFGKIARPWFKLLLEQSVENTPEMLKYAREKYAGILKSDCSYSRGVELYMPEAGKGECLRRIKEMDKTIKLTVGAGDYENDISLIQMADIGYAVANAVDDCKRVADRITVANTEHAIARIIKDIEEEFA